MTKPQASLLVEVLKSGGNLIPRLASARVVSRKHVAVRFSNSDATRFFGEFLAEAGLPTTIS